MQTRWKHFWAQTLRALATAATRRAERLEPEALPGETGGDGGIPAHWLARVRGANAAWMGVNPGRTGTRAVEARPQTAARAEPETHEARLPAAAPFPDRPPVVSPAPNPPNSPDRIPARRPSLRFSLGRPPAGQPAPDAEPRRDLPEAGVQSAPWKHADSSRPNSSVAGGRGIAEDVGPQLPRLAAPLAFSTQRNESPSRPAFFADPYAVPARADTAAFSSPAERPEPALVSWPGQQAEQAEPFPFWSQIRSEALPEVKTFPDSPGNSSGAAGTPEPWPLAAARSHRQPRWPEMKTTSAEYPWPDLPALPTRPEPDDALSDAATAHQRQRADLLELRREQRGEPWNG